MGGNIYIESELDKGSKFWIELPLNNPSEKLIIQKNVIFIQKIQILHPNKEYFEFFTNILKYKSNTKVSSEIQSFDCITLAHSSMINEDIKKKFNHGNLIVLGEELTDKHISLKLPLKFKTLTNIFCPNCFEKKPENHFEIFSDKKLLICEDNLIIHKSMKMMLKNNGYNNITSAYNGKEALNLFENGNQFDLILMDIQMPILGGIETTIKIREFCYYKNIKQPVIIICSGNTFPSEMMEFCEKNQISEILIKPITKEILIETLMKYFKK